jgi:hypothetical protein
MDAGPLVNGPLPAPLLRLDDPRNGTTYSASVMGVVGESGPPVSVPSSLGNIAPSEELQLTMMDGTNKDLFYTLPAPFSVALFPGNQLTMVFSQLEQVYGSSYGVNISDLSGKLILLTEDGLVGPALSSTDRLGFDFQLDTQQPTQTDTVPCGQRVHYPAVVSQGGVQRHLFPGQNTVFTVNGADLLFTLLDAYRVQNSACGTAPDYSIAYIVQPNG